MKSVFLVSILLMASISILAVVTLPEHHSGVPLLWWTSDPNPARGPQIAAFEDWMVDEGYGAVDLRLDSNNTGTMKVIIQSDSGVGSEIIDVYGGGQLRQYAAAGVLMDITDLAREYGFGLDKTYASAREELCVGGRQYTFPCNVTAEPLTINLAVLERDNLPRPKLDWTWDEFLTWCLAVRKTDADGNVTRYAIWPFVPRALWATNAGTVFNETMTECTADSAAVREATHFYYDLMFKHGVMPTPSERTAMSSREGYGGSKVQTLGAGSVVAIQMGRYSLIQLRKFPGFKPDVALLPHKVMPMQSVMSRSAGINKGAKDPRLAARFLQYLADQPYNRLIIDQADALAPSPASADLPEFLRPREYPGEWNAHRKYALAARDHGVGVEYSPFVSPVIVDRLTEYYLTGVDSESLTVDDALARLAKEINREIRHSAERDPKLRGLYEKARARQDEIDRLKSEGKPVPPTMVDNPVIRRLMEAGKWR